MRRVKAEKEEMPIFLAKNVTAKGLNLHVGDIVRIYKGNPEKKNRWQIINDGTNTDFAIVFASCLVPFWIA